MKNIIILLFLSVFLQSCIDCKDYIDDISRDECNLVVERPPSEYPDLFKTKGYDPITKDVKTYRDGNRWLDFYKKEIEEGDTIVKKKGELVFYIHKKDTVIAHEWVCYDGDGRHTYNK
ncbi:hypothetical protein J2X97_003282 [Epilithonimonas hungarica]|uniref:hypothetical protein n=1 Tax=Epilithonimonas hungarica TaxID=454006 RepID=UPI002783A00B|nr:hypothetical protein [Epilithonimonas hungarica]MDP9957613.1 hypothetical protein [Epilithonimonas hungarica]